MGWLSCDWWSDLSNSFILLLSGCSTLKHRCLWLFLVQLYAWVSDQCKDDGKIAHRFQFLSIGDVSDSFRLFYSRFCITKLICLLFFLVQFSAWVSLTSPSTMERYRTDFNFYQLEMCLIALDCSILGFVL
jgi:hypothetical protein